ncbi:MAG TPA: hypothetical protein VFG68_08775 [Fimbriiglobus sp.]|nr:hypothetical protein [Fimbriiglobus sp.]
MILLFPDIDTFRLALTGGVVPPEVLSAEAQVAFGADGKLSVETDAKLTRKSATELTRLGVTLAKRHIGSVEAISCWPQILPTTRDPNPPQLSSQAPVLFELESAEDLPAIVGEMLRLGNDRQSVRWLADDRDDRRVLLRVVGPPYYTLLRALDQTASGTRGAVRAYVEQAPRVWVQVGHSHELAAKVKLDEGQILLVRPPREWTYLPDAPFRDVYEVLQFQLPAGPHDWSAEPVAEKMTVPLRLTAGNAADTPELWVLRGDAANQLDAFVRDADERLTQRLKFAVATAPAGETVIVLRVTASKLAPPVLPLADSVGFKPYYKLPNLYLPAGTRLHPTLRRDAVRKLLADDTDRLVWLYPGPDGAFTPETLPEDSFRPLEDWVDYVIATNHAPLAAWVEATRFDFEHFVCNEAGKPPRDPGDGKGRRRTRADAGDTPLTTTAPAKAVKKSPDPGDRPPTQAFAARVEARKPSEWEVRRRELQDEFLRHDGPLDMPERQALWPELAVANVGANDRSEATLCWVNALWGRDTAPREWAEGWLRTELPDLDLPVTAAAFDRMMKPPDPQAPQVRQFAALLFWLTQQQPVPGWLAARLPAIKRYLEAHERSLPTRAAWLVASRLAVLTGADTLGLARVRDRLLQRLLEEGIVAERDLPFFLRSAGLKDSDRLSRVRAGVIELHQAVRTWAETSLKMPQPSVPPNHDQGATLGYIDLMFAFALAKLGEAGAARQRIESARQVLEGFQPSGDRGIAARFLLLALKYRVEQALAGKPHAGLLDRPLIEALEAIHAQGKGQPNNPFGLAHYVITRFQQKSRILEPQEKLDPYAAYMVHGDELKKALAGLARIKDPNALARTVRELYRSGVDGRPAAEARFAVLLDALPLSARVGEQFSLELVGLVPEVMKASAAVGLAISELSVKQGQLLEQALFLAAHFDRKEVVQHLVDEFIELLRVKPPEQQFELINVVASQCLRSLRRLQLRDEIDKLLRRMQEVVLGGQDVGKLRQLHRAKGAKSASRTDLWGKTLRSLLHLAGGWLTFGLTDQAARILDEARAELLGPDATPFPPQEYTLLAQAYVGALGHGPADVGLLRVVELFAAMAPGRVVNAFTSAKFYSRFHLNLVEDTVLAVVNEDFALGPAGRRWLDEDEHLVRRRIHRDMKHALAGL